MQMTPALDAALVSDQYCTQLREKLYYCHLKFKLHTKHASIFHKLLILLLKVTDIIITSCLVSIWKCVNGPIAIYHTTHFPSILGNVR